MFENSRRGGQARNFTTNVPKLLDLKSSSEQIFSEKLTLGAPALLHAVSVKTIFVYANKHRKLDNQLVVSFSKMPS